MEHDSPSFAEHDEKFGNMKFRKYLFVDWVRDLDFYEKNFKCEYIWIIEEIAPSTGNLHWHTYMILANPRSYKSIKKASIPGRRVLITKGTYEQNVEYMTKQGDYVDIYEHGEKPKGQGCRTDLQHAREIIKDGGGMRQITAEINSFQATKHAQLIMQYHEKKRNWRPEVYWYYGPRGSGKTHLAEHLSGHDYWMSNKSLRWWGDYDAHENVIFDDFRKDFCTFHELLRILDKTPYQVEVKGGMRQLLAKKIFISTQYHPRDMYNTREDVEQLLRRIKEIRHFPFPYVDKWEAENICKYCEKGIPEGYELLPESRSDNGTEVNGTEVGGNNSPDFL